MALKHIPDQCNAHKGILRNSYMRWSGELSNKEQRISESRERSEPWLVTKCLRGETNTNCDAEISEHHVGTGIFFQENLRSSHSS